MSQAASAPSAPAAGAPVNYGTEGASGSERAPEVGFDPKSALADLRKARGETQRLATAFDSHRQEVAGDRDILQKLKAAFSPEVTSAPDPVAHLEGQLDSFLEQAMELKQRGQQIPLTTQIAMNFYQSQLQNLKVIDELKKELKDLKGGVERANDPDAPVNNIAYTQMDTFIQQSLDSLYGTDPKQSPAKRRIYGTVTQALSDELRTIQQKAPGQWDMMRRTPQMLQQKVNEVLRTIVPPKAMQMIETEELKNTPMSQGELWGAFREAQAMFQSAKTEAQKAKAIDLQRSIRQDILAGDKQAQAKRRPR